MIGRRGFLGWGLAAIGFSLRPAAAGVETVTPQDSIPAFAIPRGVIVEMPATCRHLVTLQDPCHTHSVSPAVMNAQMISDGQRLVLLESEEGQRILRERPSTAVNLRSDGSIRHRQHHPTDFPPKRSW